MDGKNLAEVGDGRQNPRSSLRADGERPVKAAVNQRGPWWKPGMDGGKLHVVGDGRREPRSTPVADCNTPGLRREGTASGAKWAGNGGTAPKL